MEPTTVAAAQREQREVVWCLEEFPEWFPMGIAENLPQYYKCFQRTVFFERWLFGKEQQQDEGLMRQCTIVVSWREAKPCAKSVEALRSGSEAGLRPDGKRPTLQAALGGRDAEGGDAATPAWTMIVMADGEKQLRAAQKWVSGVAEGIDALVVSTAEELFTSLAHEESKIAACAALARGPPLGPEPGREPAPSQAGGAHASLGSPAPQAGGAAARAALAAGGAGARAALPGGPPPGLERRRFGGPAAALPCGPPPGLERRPSWGPVPALTRATASGAADGPGLGAGLPCCGPEGKLAGEGCPGAARETELELQLRGALLKLWRRAALATGPPPGLESAAPGDGGAGSLRGLALPGAKTAPTAHATPPPLPPQSQWRLPAKVAVAALSTAPVCGLAGPARPWGSWGAPPR